VRKKPNKNNDFIQLLISFSEGLELVHVVSQSMRYLKGLEEQVF